MIEFKNMDCLGFGFELNEMYYRLAKERLESYDLPTI